MMEIKNVLICGRGAVGSLMGKILFDALGKDHVVFAVDEKRKQRYEKNPLIINGQPADFKYISPEDKWTKANLALFFTKYGGLKEAMETAAPFIGPETILMSGINGIISEDDLRARFPQNTVIRTIAQKMDSRYTGSEVTYSVKGELVFGLENDQKNDPKAQEALKAVQELFDKAELPYILSKDIVKDQWSKLMANCGLNQTSAAYDAPYGKILHDPAILKVFVDAMEEVRAVANAMGIDLTEEMVKDWVQSLETYDPNSMPSMRQDVLAGRQTEEALFSKTVVPLGKKLGVPTPVLEMLMEKIDAIDAANAAKKQTVRKA
ncbi:MAG: ketopantoate reductase family protein [Erysipelotrichaceae bacterium]|nr:ketopantoate reductase family protein [Erysipelotrichaceae bacterium]